MFDNKVEDFMAKLAAQTAPMTKNNNQSKNRVIEKISLNFPGNYGRYQILPMNSVVTDFPYVTLLNTREICIPRKQVAADGTETEYNAWIRILPKNAYQMKDMTGRVVSSLTAEEDQILGEAYTVFDQLFDEIDARNDLEMQKNLARKRNYTVFHAMCLNKWDFEDSRAPKKQNFCGLFVCTAKGFMNAVEDNINEKNLMNGGDGSWIKGVYTDELTGRDGFVMFSISRSKTSAGYSVTVYTIKIDSIVGLFKAGTVVADLEFTALDADGNPTTASTTGEGKNNTAAGGFWMDMESHPMEWTTSVKSYFVNNYNTRIEIGHMPRVFEGGEKTTGSLFYVLDNEYYELKMDIQIGEKEDTTKVITKPEECAIVATKYYTYRIVPNNTDNDYQKYGKNAAGETDYHLMDKPIDLDINFIEAQLGTASPTFYGEVIDTLGNATYSKKYSCDPNPGFWMEPAAKVENKSSVSTWKGGDTYGICYANGVFQFFQYPSSQSVGAKYVDNFYLVNQDAGKQIKYVITVVYVEQIQAEAETLETFTLNLPARDPSDPENGTYTPYDLTPMYEAFGCTPEEFTENGTWMAIDSDGDLSNNYDELEGFAFDENSKLSDDDASLVALVGYIAEENGFFSWILDDENLAKTYTFTIYAYYNNQRCEFNITVGDASAINFVELNKSDGKIFDLTGRLVKNATKGIYIKDGKKFLVK